MHDRAKFVIFAQSATVVKDYKIYSQILGIYIIDIELNEDGKHLWKDLLKQSWFDRSAEEGLNIQGQNRHIVHFDLPLNVNRIEQRMGRIDHWRWAEKLCLNKAIN